MNKQELNEINLQFIKRYDKNYRMFAGLSSSLINIENETIHLTIKHSSKWGKDPVTTAVQLSKIWQCDLNENHNVKVISYNVTIYFIGRDEESGLSFHISTPTSVIEKAFANLKSDSNLDLSKRPKVQIIGEIYEDLRFWWHAEECAHFCQVKRGNTLINNRTNLG